MKREVDTETLLHWALAEEMWKRNVSAAEANWQNLYDQGERGGVSIGGGTTPQRYAAISAPHPDAIAIEREVKRLPELLGEKSERVTIDYEGSWPTIFADMPWMAPGGLTLPTHNIVVVVTSCAVMQRRPRWNVGKMMPNRTIGANGRPVVKGVDTTTKRYLDGARCPIDWSPSPREVAEARAEYLLWHHALTQLAISLGDSLGAHVPLRPAAPQMPWMMAPEAQPARGRIFRNPLVTPQVLAAVKARRRRGGSVAV